MVTTELAEKAGAYQTALGNCYDYAKGADCRIAELEAQLAEVRGILEELGEGVGLADLAGYWGCPMCEGAAYQTGDPIQHKEDCKLDAFLSK